MRDCSTEVVDTCHATDQHRSHSDGKTQKYEAHGSILYDGQSNSDAASGDKNDKRRWSGCRWHGKRATDECISDVSHHQQSSNFSRDVSRHRHCSDDKLPRHYHHHHSSISPVRWQHREHEYGHHLVDDNSQKHFQMRHRDKHSGHSTNRSRSGDKRHRHTHYSNCSQNSTKRQRH